MTPAPTDPTVAEVLVQKIKNAFDQMPEAAFVSAMTDLRVFHAEEVEPLAPPATAVLTGQVINPLGAIYRACHSTIWFSMEKRAGDVGVRAALTELLVSYQMLVHDMSQGGMPMTHLAFQHAAAQATDANIARRWMMNRAVFDLGGAGLTLVTMHASALKDKQAMTAERSVGLLSNRREKMGIARSAFFRIPESTPVDFGSDEDAIEAELNRDLLAKRNLN